MKKKVLLEMIDKSTLKHDADPGKRELYGYYQQIKDLLYAFPSDAEIKIDILDKPHFKNKNRFEDFIRSENSSVIDKELYALYSGLQNWVKERPEEVEVFNRRSRLKKRWFRLFVAVMGLMIICATVFTILDAFSIYEWGKLSIVFDGLGLIVGLAFPLYEFIDDRKKEGIHEEAVEDYGEFKQKYKLVTQINKSKVDEMKQYVKFSPGTNASVEQSNEGETKEMTQTVEM